jgi:hypothetical protein
MSSLSVWFNVSYQFETSVPELIQGTLLQLHEAISTNSSRIKFAKCSQMYSNMLCTVEGGGGGKGPIPPAAPTPFFLPYRLLYICTVNELCSRTIRENGLGGGGVVCQIPRLQPQIGRIQQAQNVMTTSLC